MDFTKIKNIIFDLGNVVIDINPQLSYSAFSSISEHNPCEIEQLLKEKKIWLDYEKGILTETQFRDTVRTELKIFANDLEIDAAFNALLLPIDPNRINLIEAISAKYNTYVLSNTSLIHMIEFENILHEYTGRKTIWPLFVKPFFSYEMGMLKPNDEIYLQVLLEANILPNETLFIDDLKANIDAAANLGFQVIHLQPPYTIIDHLANAL